MNTVALGIRVDTVPSKKAWAKELGIKNTRLLSDFWLLKVYPGSQLPDIEEIIKYLQDLNFVRLRGERSPLPKGGG